MKHIKIASLLAFLLTLGVITSCKGEGTSPTTSEAGLEGQSAESIVAINDKSPPENPDAQVAQNTQGNTSGTTVAQSQHDGNDDQKYIKVRTGTPTVGGQHCPAGSAMGENANDTMGNVAIPGNNKSFTCTITFSTPYPKGPICVITGSGWVTPPDMTFKINAASAESIEVTGVTQTDPLAGYVFNYICL